MAFPDATVPGRGGTLSNHQQYGGQQYGAGQQPLPPAFPQQQPYGQQQYAVQQQPGFGWGPQFNQGQGMPPGPGWQGGPPRKKRNTGLLVSLGILGVCAAIGVALLGFALNNSAEDHPTVTQPRYTPSPRSTPSSDPYPTGEPTQVPTTTRPTRPAPTRTTPSTPPPPSTREVLTKNRFYVTGLQASVGCRESAARQTDIGAASVYIGQIKRCLDRAWPRQVRAGRHTFQPPSLVVMNGVVGTTPCGGGSAFRSFYCTSNQTIYMDALSGVRDYKKANSYSNTSQVRMFVRMRTSQTMAHEYGHHLQEITGIFDAYAQARYDQNTYSARLEVNRRMELQASCLGGLFMGANKNSYPVTGRARTEWNWLVIHSGDEYDTERTHGSRIVHSYWAQRGFNSRNPGLCNTFTAGSPLVR